MQQHVPRKAWGARPPKQRQRITAIQGMVVHYSASGADEQDDHKNCAARVRGIQRYHMLTHGWNDIAYSFLFCRHGYTFEGRGWGIRTAAQGTNPGNEHYHAFCFLGNDNVQRRDVTVDARRALVHLIVESLHRYPDGKRLRPHSQFTSTNCPGDELRKELARLRKLLGLLP